MIFVMEFLSGYQLLDRCLYKGIASENVARGLGLFMALTHAKTHSSLVSPERAEAMSKAFENKAIRRMQLEFVFTGPFVKPERSEWLRSDKAFMDELEEVKGTYISQNRGDSALLHGDLHPGNVMVDGDNFKVIDPEFCIYGPPGLDVGMLISGYVLAYIHQVA